MSKRSTYTIKVYYIIYVFMSLNVNLHQCVTIQDYKVRNTVFVQLGLEDLSTAWADGGESTVLWRTAKCHCLLLYFVLITRWLIMFSRPNHHIFYWTVINNDLDKLTSFQTDRFRDNTTTYCTSLLLHTSIVL